MSRSRPPRPDLNDVVRGVCLDHNPLPLPFLSPVWRTSADADSAPIRRSFEVSGEMTVVKTFRSWGDASTNASEAAFRLWGVLGGEVIGLGMIATAFVIDPSAASRTRPTQSPRASGNVSSRPVVGPQRNGKRGPVVVVQWVAADDDRDPTKPMANSVDMEVLGLGRRLQGAVLLDERP